MSQNQMIDLGDWGFNIEIPVGMQNKVLDQTAMRFEYGLKLYTEARQSVVTINLGLLYDTQNKAFIPYVPMTPERLDFISQQNKSPSLYVQELLDYIAVLEQDARDVDAMLEHKEHLLEKNSKLSNAVRRFVHKTDPWGEENLLDAYDEWREDKDD